MDDRQNHRADVTGEHIASWAVEAPRFCARALFAGSAVATTTLAVMAALGAAIAQRSHSLHGGYAGQVFTDGWFVLAIVSAGFAGGLAAGRVSRHRSASGGLLEGLFAWVLALGAMGSIAAIALVRHAAALVPHVHAAIGHATYSSSAPLQLAERLASWPAGWTMATAIALSCVAAALASVSACDARIAWLLPPRERTLS